MSPSPPNASKRLSTISLVVVTIITILIVLPFPASAMPIVPVEPAPSPGSPSPSPGPSHSHMSHKIIFDIVFGLGLSFLSIGAFAFLASRKSFSGFSGVLDRICAALDSLKQLLSAFRFTTFFARAGNAIAGATDPSVSSMRDRVTSAPTISLARMQSSGPISAHDPDPQTPTVSV
ncbi:hypothetical protein EDB92DRAFT_1949007 [Lactarius akahatsu]|uniref:Uncharacterized protein n=1 Tax=Lactarius akahatsu TaxID=416441 RepID=A0AAD4LGM1_9AGAM|nr:hypothetical protein EDB92DRAFT_1949007 [Lactarius akahatsu]